MLTHLNEQQKQAVTHKSGPLLIIAGAGTGKTKVITHRIAHIIKKGWAKPEEIVALTFTEKAASEMEERADILLPYGTYDLLVTTFHSFGEKILKEYAPFIGLALDYKLLNKIDQLIFLRENIYELPLKILRPVTNPLSHINQFASLFSRLKEETIEPKDYLKWAKDDLKKAKDKITKEKAKIHIEAARAYEKYEDLKKENNVLDFSDLIFLTYKLLKKRPEVRAKLQKQFKYILVDEFQDTNFLQNEIIKMLAGENGNITVVGDDDQSIYRWRGASISNILFFQKEYPKAKKIVLAQNYRSPQEILDLAYQTIQKNNPDRLEIKAKINKRLIAMESFKEAINFNYFDTVGSEADFVIAEIKNAKKKKVPLREIAIILRSNSLAGHYIKALNSAGIPYVFSGESGIYFKPEIQMIISLIKVLVSNRDVQAYYNLLKSNAYNIDSGDLAEIFDLIRYQSLSTFKTLQNIDAYKKNLHLSDVTIKKINQFVQNIITLREKEKEVASGQLIYHFLKIKKILFNLSRKQSVENELKIKNIADFFNQIILEFEKVSRDHSISNLAKYIDDLLSVYASPEIGEIDPEMEAVRVLTYHASKGLEFEVVFMPALTSDYLPTRERTELIDIPTDFIHEILPEGNYHLQEERRLFYVGATRAKKHLFLTYAANYGGKRAKKISPFLVEALGEKALEKIKKVQLTRLQQIELFASAESNQKSLIETNGPVSLNAYAIDDYNTCPLKYKFAKILRVPVMQSFPVAFGSSIHNALNEYYKKLLIGKKINLQDLLKIFKQNWRNEGYMHKKHEQEALAQGKEAMKNFLNSEFSKTKPISTETPFSLNLDGILIRGRFDAIFPGEKGVRIFDFKSSFLGEEEGLRRARESLQLKLYAWAYYKIKKNLPQSLGLVFLNSNHHAEITPTLRQFKSLEEKIRTTARGIRQKEFEATPSQFTCRYCAFRETCPFAYN
ncbi:MAG: ATP-dependent DNA helicase [Patescibacteria group bacterium]|nr:ATP-dependent DNA helicase [Patescibacteria group bacterium]